MVDNSKDFLADVSDRANLTREEARELTEDFLKALPGFVSREAWELIAGLTPVEVAIDWEEVEESDDHSIEDFLLEMSSEEEVESPRAAEHARVVAETIRSHAGPGQIEALRSAIEDETMLALFETVRGEFTSAETSEEG